MDPKELERLSKMHNSDLVRRMRSPISTAISDILGDIGGPILVLVFWSALFGLLVGFVLIVAR